MSVEPDKQQQQHAQRIILGDDVPIDCLGKTAAASRPRMACLVEITQQNPMDLFVLRAYLSCLVPTTKQTEESGVSTLASCTQAAIFLQLRQRTRSKGESGELSCALLAEQMGSITVKIHVLVCLHIFTVPWRVF